MRCVPQVIKKFENDKSFLISAFINFYGKNNAEYIINKINSANIIWYDSKEIKENDDILSHIVTNLPKDKLEYFLSQRSRTAFLQSAYIDELNLLVLPQNYNISHIIHEINHMIGSHILSLSPYRVINGISYSVEKSDGVVLGNDSMNEVINQMMTFDIVNELKKLGMNIVYTSSWQDNAFPLLMPFYNKFKESLKELYISGNFTKFVSQFDEERFQDFTQSLFIKLFRIQRQLRNNEQVLVSDEEIKLMENMVNGMSQYVSESRKI